MAKPSKKNKKNRDNFKEEIIEIESWLKEETKQTIYAVIFFVLALLSVLSSLHFSGLVGDKIYSSLFYLFGIGYFLLPLLFLILGFVFLRPEKKHFNLIKAICATVIFLSGLGIIDILWLGQGGKVGGLLSYPLIKLFEFWTSLIILFALIAISSLVLFETKLTLDTLFFWRRFRKDEGEEEFEEDEVEIAGLKDEDEDEAETENTEEDDEDEKKKVEEEAKRDEKKKKPLKGLLGLDKKTEEYDSLSIKVGQNATNRAYMPPPLSMLEKDKGKPVVGDIKANANIIKRTLQNFGIDVEMDEVSIGPSITRYALKPAEGVKLSRIVALQSDLSLALAAHPIRIEAPIPGKSLVGIEIPNQIKTMVGMATLLGSEEYQNSDKPLLVSLGKGISGKAHFTNLAKMPHCLIAGTTGSGKSVTIHTIINSLLFRNSPTSLKFIMIDPKRVELTLYNKIPHLLTPVITDAKKTILALKWAAKEMDRRYDILEAEAVKDIDSYHKNVLAPEMEKITELQKSGDYDPAKHKLPEVMPYIVIIIDELADIMLTYPRELEAAIVRLAQMSRAVGIHLILSTQRPSVNVITGLIKANIPSRIALQVASQVDSRTILDAAGAEKLLGAGDMLYLGGEMSKPVRIQSAYISETEVKKVVKYLADSFADEIPGEVDMTSNLPDKNVMFESMIGNEDPDEDDLYETAKEEVIKAGKASTSYIQRKLRVGYARAARLMDILEQKGVIGPADGSRPREVINGGADETGTTPMPNEEERVQGKDPYSDKIDTDFKEDAEEVKEDDDNQSGSKLSADEDEGEEIPIKKTYLY